MNEKKKRINEIFHSFLTTEILVSVLKKIILLFLHLI